MVAETMNNIYQKIFNKQTRDFVVKVPILFVIL